MSHDSDETEDSRNCSAVAQRSSQFVRRLIPTVAAATISFTSVGCLPGGGDGENDGGIGGGDTSTAEDGDNGAGISIDDDGQVDESELRSLCQTWMDCEPDNFQSEMGTVTECVTYFQEEYLDYYRQRYEEYYGMECVEAWEATIECALGGAYCGEDRFERVDPNNTCSVDHGFYDYCGSA